MRVMASGAPSRTGTTAEPARPSTKEASMSTPLLESTARTLVAPGRGILAADESHSTIGGPTRDDSRDQGDTGTKPLARRLR